MKLIIIEGIPGSGKSSTARFIALQFERNGYKTELFHESTLQHPILIDEDIRDSIDWRESYISNWIKFLENRMNNNEEIIVFESVLLQSPIIKLLHLDIDRGLIVEFIDQLNSLLTKIDCSLIFLNQGDPTVGIQRMMKIRGGEEWLNNTYEKYKDEPYYKNRHVRNKELHLEFLYEYAAIAETAYSEAKLTTIKIDNTEWDWNQYHSRIVNFLKLSHKSDPILHADELEKFIGHFHNKEMGLTVQIEIRNNELIIFNHYILKPRDIYKFYLDNISMSLEYLIDSNGEFPALMIYEKDIVGNRNDEGTRFERIS